MSGKKEELKKKKSKVLLSLVMAPPTFMGLTGRPLSLMVSTVATTGFVLFGYDQGVSKQRPPVIRFLSHTSIESRHIAEIFGLRDCHMWLMV